MSAADFKAPSDANADNSYEVTVEVSDGNDGSDQLALSVIINDVSQLALHVFYLTPNANLGGGVTASATGFVEDKEDGEELESDVNFISVEGQ